MAHRGSKDHKKSRSARNAKSGKYVYQRARTRLNKIARITKQIAILEERKKYWTNAR
jgi:hypothetical protein